MDKDTHFTSNVSTASVVFLDQTSVATHGPVSPIARSLPKQVTFVLPNSSEAHGWFPEGVHGTGRTRWPRGARARAPHSVAPRVGGFWLK